MPYYATETFKWKQINNGKKKPSAPRVSYLVLWYIQQNVSKFKKTQT